MTEPNREEEKRAVLQRLIVMAYPAFIVTEDGAAFIEDSPAPGDEQFRRTLGEYVLEMHGDGLLEEFADPRGRRFVPNKQGRRLAVYGSTEEPPPFLSK